MADDKGHLSTSEIGMIADDLAGSCDTGFEFLEVAGQVTVVVDSDTPHRRSDPPEGLLVYNTESRDLPPERAYQKVRRAARAAARDGVRVWMKKTDSAFRGSFGREIAAVMDELDIRLCCIAPAIPDFGRTTKNGIQYIDGLPIAETFYRRDPKHPVTASRVADHAARDNPRPIGLLDLGTLRCADAQGALDDMIAGGVQMITADSESDQDLMRVAGLFLAYPGPVLFVGGQGIGSAVAGHCRSRIRPEGWAKVPGGPVLVVCGTLHPRSREQLRYFSETCRLEPVLIDIPDAASLTAGSGRAADRLTEQMDRSGIGLLATSERSAADPELLETGISRTVRKICDQRHLSGLLLTGGTTGYEACRGLGGHRLRLRRRISPGAVMAQAPDLSDMAVLIKGGSLGRIDAFAKFVETVKERTSMSGP